MPLKLKAQEVVRWTARRCPPHRLNKKDAGMGNNTPADINEPELTQSALKF